jgi:hypothetical protein
MTVKSTKKSFLLEKTKKTKKREKTTPFFNTETETDPDRNPTFEQKTNPDPDRCQKVKPEGLWLPDALNISLQFAPFLQMHKMSSRC